MAAKLGYQRERVVGMISAVDGSQIVMVRAQLMGYEAWRHVPGAMPEQVESGTTYKQVVARCFARIGPSDWAVSIMQHCWFPSTR